MAVWQPYTVHSELQEGSDVIYTAKMGTSSSLATICHNS